jgi:hypothetical protein
MRGVRLLSRAVLAARQLAARRAPLRVARAMASAASCRGAPVALPRAFEAVVPSAAAAAAGAPAAPPLVSPAALAAALAARTPVAILDASWFLPTAGRDPRTEFAKGPRIPGARFFDIDGVADASIPLPHMLPPPPVLREAARALGIDARTPVVVYDSAGLFSAARAWWTLAVA